MLLPFNIFTGIVPKVNIAELIAANAKSGKLMDSVAFVKLNKLNCYNILQHSKGPQYLMFLKEDPRIFVGKSNTLEMNQMQI